MVDCISMMLGYLFKNATILSFQFPEEAFEELRQTDPDLLITDDHMPQLRGCEIVERLATRGANLSNYCNFGLFANQRLGTGVGESWFEDFLFVSAVYPRRIQAGSYQAS